MTMTLVEAQRLANEPTVRMDADYWTAWYTIRNALERRTEEYILADRADLWKLFRKINDKVGIKEAAVKRNWHALGIATD